MIQALVSHLRVGHHFSVDDYEAMVAHGILSENDRVELIRGEVLEKMTIGDPHAACVNRLNQWFVRHVGDNAVVSIQNPVRLLDSVPEPDVTVLRPRADFYSSGKPRPADVLLLVEVSDSSLPFDRDVKGPLYAENGIAEYWVVKLQDICIEVHRRPQPDGRYADVRTVGRGESIEVAALPGCVFRVDDAF